MPLFVPPVTDGQPMGDPTKPDPANRLWRHYGAWAQGQTVWKDSGGVWHTDAYPYQGGGTTTIHDGTETTVTGPDEGLDTADVVYLGGHEHPVTDAEAAELVAAGFTVAGHHESEEQKWVDYAVAADPNVDYMGGDACASQLIGDGRTLWTFADNIVGTVDGDGYYDTINVSRNAFVIQDDTGAITSQVLIAGAHTPFRHPTAGDWWWPLDITLDGVGDGVDSLVVAALHMTPGGLFGDHVANDLLLINLFGVVGSSVEVTQWGNDWEINTVYNDTAFHYITGQPRAELTTLQAYTVLARAPLGSLTTPASWENWDGTGWSTGPAAFLEDNHDAAIEGSTTITRSGDTWILAAMTLRDPQVRLYRATDPQGPYTAYHTGGGVSHPQGLVSDAKTQGAPPNGGFYVYYQPKFHEHLAPSATNLVLSYNRNVFATGFPHNLVGQPNDYHVSTYCPQFVYLPTPEGV